jgi:hypothetical protein
MAAAQRLLKLFAMELVIIKTEQTFRGCHFQTSNAFFSRDFGNLFIEQRPLKLGTIQPMPTFKIV